MRKNFQGTRAGAVRLVGLARASRVFVEFGGGELGASGTNTLIIG